MEQSHFRLVLGVVWYLTVGIAIALIATINLSAEDYTIFMAYTSVVGVVLLGPSAAIEQQSTLVALRHGISLGKLVSRLFVPCAGLAVLICTVVLLPIGHWQMLAFGEHKSMIQVVMLIALPALLFSCIARGRANGLGAISEVANSHVVFGTVTILITMIVWHFSEKLLAAILIGQVAGWIAPGLFLQIVIGRKDTHREVMVPSASMVGQSSLLVASNLLLLCNVLASQFIFRLHADRLGVDESAQAQLIVALSCVSCAIALGVLPTLIHQARHREMIDYLKQPIVSAVVVAGVAIPFATVLLGKVAIRILLDSQPLLSMTDITLIASSATSLVVALVLAAQLLASEKIRLSIVAWMTGLACLVFFVWSLDGAGISQLSLAIALGSAGAPTALYIGARWSTNTTFRIEGR